MIIRKNWFWSNQHDKKQTNYVVTKNIISHSSQKWLFDVNSSFHSLSKLEIVSGGFRLDPSDDTYYYS